MFWDTFIDLCAKNGKKPNPVAKELGFGSSAVTHWKKGTAPSDISLKKIADYFGVSVDYLLGKTEQKEKPSPEGESEEAMKVALFGGDTEVTDEMWREVLNYAEFIKQKYNKT